MKIKEVTLPQYSIREFYKFILQRFLRNSTMKPIAWMGRNCKLKQTATNRELYPLIKEFCKFVQNNTVQLIV